MIRASLKVNGSNVIQQINSRKMLSEKNNQLFTQTVANSFQQIVPSRMNFMNAVRHAGRDTFAAPEM